MRGSVSYTTQPAGTTFVFSPSHGELPAGPGAGAGEAKRNCVKWRLSEYCFKNWGWDRQGVKQVDSLGLGL